MVAELGGNNAFLVLADADVERAAAAAAYGAFTHQGQVCMATGRVLVDDAVVEPFPDRLATIADGLTVGNPLDEADLGPVINDSQADAIADVASRSVDAGARLVAGGEREGPFLRPTVPAGVTPDMAAFAEEIFGPVAPVTAVKGDDEAVRLANGTPDGLFADVSRARRSAPATSVDSCGRGMVHINDQTLKRRDRRPLRRDRRLRQHGAVRVPVQPRTVHPVAVGHRARQAEHTAGLTGRGWRPQPCQRNPNSCPATRRIWTSSAPSVIR